MARLADLSLGTAPSGPLRVRLADDAGRPSACCQNRNKRRTNTHERQWQPDNAIASTSRIPNRSFTALIGIVFGSCAVPIIGHLREVRRMSTSPPHAARDPSIGAVHGEPSRSLDDMYGLFPITREIGYVPSRKVIAWPRPMSLWQGHCNSWPGFVTPQGAVRFRKSAVTFGNLAASKLGVSRNCPGGRLKFLVNYRQPASRVSFVSGGRSADTGFAGSVWVGRTCQNRMATAVDTRVF